MRPRRVWRTLPLCSSISSSSNSSSPSDGIAEAWPRGICKAALTAHVAMGCAVQPRVPPSATSAPGLGPPLPHLRRDWAHPCHICAELRCASAAASATGRGESARRKRQCCVHAVLAVAPQHLAQSRCRCGRRGHSPGAVWQRWAQSRCKYGRGELSPGADVGGEPSPNSDVARVSQIPIQM